MRIRISDLKNQFLLPLWNDKSLEVIDAYVAPRADIQTTFAMGRGPSPLKKNAEYKFHHFSSFQVSIQEMLQEKDQFIYKWTANAFHTGPVFNSLPTGKKLDFSGITSAKIKNGLIISYRSFSDIPRVVHEAYEKSRQIEFNGEPNHFDKEKIIELILRVTGKRLTNREIECLHLWLKGFSIKDSARTLGGLSSRTVQTFRENIKRKLNVETYQELFSLVLRSGTMPVFLMPQGI